MIPTAQELAERLLLAAMLDQAGKPHESGPVVLQGRYRAQLQWRNATDAALNRRSEAAAIKIFREHMA